MLLLQFFDQSKEETNCAVMPLDSQLHIATIVFEYLNVDELVTQLFDHTE